MDEATSPAFRARGLGHCEIALLIDPDTVPNTMKHVVISFGLMPLFVMTGYSNVSMADDDGRPAKPNVVLILTDDLGWQDVKCYDIDNPSPTETPNLDALAQRGVMFWQAYSPAPTCAPSRCAILSGNHPARAQKTHVVGGAPPHARGRAARMMDPWYSGRMPADEMTLARALAANGYTTGHVGKWHVAISHHAFPQPKDVGFDFTRSSRGAHSGMKDRLSGFATRETDDPYRLDENGFPFHQNNEDAMSFIRENKSEPFFLYYATWLVHSPIMTRSEALLDKYVQKLGVDPAKVITKDTPGQLNPYYCAMVEALDYYIGQFIDVLDTTEDPRWPGHKLSENTYLIFTSDNGGMEGSPKERYTDNNPLDRGKISAKEGGTRVPLFVIGPRIANGVQSNVMVNGLDFYPTLLSLTGSPLPDGKRLDGCDLASLLVEDPTDSRLVKHADGEVRDTMAWHFPHGVAMESTIRIGDYKLIRNYDHLNDPSTPELELFQLYDSGAGDSRRVDIEEAVNLAEKMPEKTLAMNQRLSEILTEMNASYPHYNPHCATPLPGQQQICKVTSVKRKGRKVTGSYEEHGSPVVAANLIYTLNGGEKYEEWFREPVELLASGKIETTLPKGTTHFFINLIDENRFLVSHPSIGRSGKSFTEFALSTSEDTASSQSASDAFLKKDTDGDGQVSESEYVADSVAGFDRKDKNNDEQLTREEHSHASFDTADADGNGVLSRDEFKSIFSRQFQRLDKDNSGGITPEEMKRR